MVLGSKLEEAGLLYSEVWKKHPFKAAGRVIPVRIKRIKRKYNFLFNNRI